jgi:hypothetical protein
LSSEYPKPSKGSQLRILNMPAVNEVSFNGAKTVMAKKDAAAATIASLYA